MNKNSCCFIGHRKIKKSSELWEKIINTIENLIENGAELIVSNYENLDKILDASKKVLSVCKVHLAVNTGMNRFGFRRIIDIINVIKNIILNIDKKLIVTKVENGD